VLFSSSISSNLIVGCCSRKMLALVSVSPLAVAKLSKSTNDLISVSSSSRLSLSNKLGSVISMVSMATSARTFLSVAL
jgi:hypothetical protein